jgi:hypothetical protein
LCPQNGEEQKGNKDCDSCRHTPLVNELAIIPEFAAFYHRFLDYSHDVRFEETSNGHHA